MIKAVIYGMDGVIPVKKAGMFCVGFDQKGNQNISKADITVTDFKENSRDKIFEFFGLNMSLLRSSDNF